MITKPHFTKFRISETLQFMTDGLSICEKYQPNQLQFTEKVTVLRNTTQTLNSSFKVDQGSSISAEIIALDQRRDLCFTGIHLCVDAFSYHFIPDIRNAASLILNSIDKYGKNITQLNYQAETSTLKSIIDSWTNDIRLTNALEALNISSWVTELKTVNEQFNKAYLSRVEEKALVPKANTLELRKKTIAAFRDLINNIEARATIALKGEYNPLISELNTLIGKYNSLVDVRRGTTKSTTSNNSPLSANQAYF